MLKFFLKHLYFTVQYTYNYAVNDENILILEFLIKFQKNKKKVFAFKSF